MHGHSEVDRRLYPRLRTNKFAQRQTEFMDLFLILASQNSLKF